MNRFYRPFSINILAAIIDQESFNPFTSTTAANPQTAESGFGGHSYPPVLSPNTPVNFTAVTLAQIHVVSDGFKISHMKRLFPVKHMCELEISGTYVLKVMKNIP